MKKDSQTKREEEIDRFLKANQIIQKAERHEKRRPPPTGSQNKLGGGL